MSDVNPPWRFGRSIVAVLVGMVVGVAITLGTDEILHIVGVFPPWGASMIGFDGALLLATSYRTVYGVQAVAACLSGWIPWPCGEHCRSRSDVEQGACVRASLVSSRARCAGDATGLGGRQIPNDAVARTGAAVEAGASNRQGDH